MSSDRGVTDRGVGPPSVNLVVSRGLFIRGRLVRRAALGLVVISLAFMVSFALMLAFPSRSSGMAADEWGLFMSGFVFVAFLVTTDFVEPLGRRLGTSEPLHLVATVDGVGGQMYPAARFVRVSGSKETSESQSATVWEVRSRLFRSLIASSETPNFTRWPQAVVTISAGLGSFRIRFWAPRGVRRGLLGGVACELSLAELLSFLPLALGGGADVHVAPQLRSQASVGHLLACPLHDAQISRVYGRVGATRLPARATDPALRQWIKHGAA